MSETSTRPTLAARLQARSKEHRRQMDEIIESEFQHFRDSWRLHTSAELASMSSAMASRLRRAWLVPLLIGLSMTIGLAGGSWSVLSYLGHRIQDRMAELQILNAQLDELDGLGITTQRNSPSEIYIVLPSGWTGQATRFQSGQEGMIMTKD